MKKTVVFSVMLCFCVNLVLVSVSNCGKNENCESRIYKNIIVLESPMLGFIDGKNFGMNANTFGLLLQVRREMRKRLFGIPTHGGKRVGMYNLYGKQYSLIELTKIEGENEVEYYSKKSYLEKNKSRYTSEIYQKELCKIEEKYKKAKVSLAEVLHWAKEDFLQITAGYMDSAKGMKGPLLMLIQEFCDKKGLEDCFILTWGQTVEGEEDENLRCQVYTFNVFTQFCEDLAGFLEAMARACPKAKSMFLEVVRKAKEERASKRACGS